MKARPCRGETGPGVRADGRRGRRARPSGSPHNPPVCARGPRLPTRRGGHGGRGSAAPWKEAARPCTRGVIWLKIYVGKSIKKLRESHYGLMFPGCKGSLTLYVSEAINPWKIVEFPHRIHRYAQNVFPLDNNFQRIWKKYSQITYNMDVLYNVLAYNIQRNATWRGCKLTRYICATCIGRRDPEGLMSVSNLITEAWGWDRGCGTEREMGGGVSKTTKKEKSPRNEWGPAHDRRRRGAHPRRNEIRTRQVSSLFARGRSRKWLGFYPLIRQWGNYTSKDMRAIYRLLRFI